MEFLKQFSSFGFGIVGAVAFMSSQNVDIYAAVEHIQNGIREMAAGAAILGPIGIGAYAAYRKATKSA